MHTRSEYDFILYRAIFLSMLCTPFHPYSMNIVFEFSIILEHRVFEQLIFFEPFKDDSVTIRASNINNPSIMQLYGKLYTYGQCKSMN